MITSNVQIVGKVPFAAYAAEKIYMQEFTKKQGLPKHLRRWQETVDAMLDGLDTSGPIYLMVDQAPVKAAETHRRVGVHVDGYWNPGIQAHGSPSRPGHRGNNHIHGGDEKETLILASTEYGCRAYAGDYFDLPKAGGDCGHIDTAILHIADMEPGIAYSGQTLAMLHESVPVKRDCFRTVVRLNVPGV